MGERHGKVTVTKEYVSINGSKQGIIMGVDESSQRMNIFRGSFSSYQSLGQVMATTDLVELVPTLNVPVFILQGKHDYQTTRTQAKRFFESVEAPYKKMYTFEHSAHTPFLEEQERFLQIMEEEVLSILIKN